VKPEPFVIIRYDVDSEPEYAPKMVKLENESGISSYYFGCINGALSNGYNKNNR